MDSSNEWAETGTMVHAGADAFHKTGIIEIGLANMAKKKAELPLANDAKAKAAFLQYAKRSHEWGEVKVTEQKVTARIRPAASDPTQEEVVINGTLDQIRPGVTCDMKTGGKYVGADLLQIHAAQLAAYQVGWFQKSGERTRAAIIRTADFLTGGQVYYPAKWSFEDAYLILESVAEFVAQVRRSVVIKVSGSHCRYCPAGGIEYCTKGTTAPRNINNEGIKSVSELFK